MAKKYLDYSGLSYFWSKLKALVGGKADKVSSATNGHFAGLTSAGNLVDSGKSASDFAAAGHNHDGVYKPKQSAVSDPTASGNSVTFIATLSQDANGVVSPTKKTVSTVTASSGGTGGNAGLMTAAQAEKLAGIANNANNYSHPTTTAASAAAVKVGKDSLGHVVVGDALTKSDVGLGNVGNFKAVSTVASQGLTDTEKSNARANIGAGTSSFSGAYADLSGKPTLGTAAAKDVPSSGNATNAQVVLGSDSRLSDSRNAADVYAWAKASTKPSYSWGEINDKPSSFTPSSHAHGNIQNDGTITSTAVTAATGILVYDSNNKIQRATAAQTRSIIGAGTSSFSGAYADLSGKPTLGTAAAKDVPSSGNATNAQVVMGNDSRLSDSRNAADVYAWAKASTKPSYSFSEISGTVSSSQLPSYVDDVLEYASRSNFPTTGESGKIYVALDTNLTYRWSGTAYVEISPSLALGETSSTAYRGDRGKTAYDHSQSAHARTDATKVEASSTNGYIKINGTDTAVYTHPSGTNPHGTTKSDVGLGNVGNFKAVSTVADQGLSATEKSNARANIEAGTVTSVGMSAPTGFSVSGSPVTSSGTLTLSFASGYSLPTTAKQTNWDTAYTNSHTHSNKTVLDGISSTKVSNWDTAYGWGNHASAGYELASRKVSSWSSTTTNTNYPTEKLVKDSLDGKQATISDLATIRSNASNGNTAYGWGNHAAQGYFDGVQWDSSVGNAGGLYFGNGSSGETVAIEFSDYAHRLGTGDGDRTSEGSATKPVYFDDGAPVACSYSLNTTVPSNAVFTDTWKAANTSQEGYAPKLELSSTAIMTDATNDYVLTYKNGTETAPVWRKLSPNAYLNTWKAANTSQEGYVPRLQLASTPTISSQTNDYVLTYTSGTETAPVWRKLPANAFNNTWVALSSSSAGYAPAANNGQSTSPSNNYYFLGYTGNSVSWYHLPANAFNNTTYESKTAASGGTDVSLVTTGEKYTWNNKISSADLTTHAKVADASATNRVLMSVIQNNVLSYSWKDFSADNIDAVGYNPQFRSNLDRATALINIEACPKQFVSDYSIPCGIQQFAGSSHPNGEIEFANDFSDLVWSGFREGRAYKWLKITGQPKGNLTTIVFHNLFALHDDYVLIDNKTESDISIDFNVKASSVIIKYVDGDGYSTTTCSVDKILAPSNITIPAGGYIEMSAVGVPVQVDPKNGVACIVVTVSEPLTAYTA